MSGISFHCCTVQDFEKNLFGWLKAISVFHYVWYFDGNGVHIVTNCDSLDFYHQGQISTNVCMSFREKYSIQMPMEVLKSTHKYQIEFQRQTDHYFLIGETQEHVSNAGQDAFYDFTYQLCPI